MARVKIDRPDLVMMDVKLPDQDGLDVVDLLVPASVGTVLAQQAATGQIALILTRRSP